MARDYDMFDRRTRPDHYDWNGEDAWQSDRDFERPTRRSGWVASPVTSRRATVRREDDEDWREYGIRDSERYGPRYDDDVERVRYTRPRYDDDDDRARTMRSRDDDLVRFVRSDERRYDRDRDARRTFDAGGPEYYRRAGDRNTWYRPDEDRDVRYTRHGWMRDDDDWDWERREPRDYFTTVSYRDYEDDDVRYRRDREREIPHYQPGARYGYDPDRERGLRAGRDYDQPSPRFYREVDDDEDWYEPGPHTGRGPRGYARSDARIQEDVSDELTEHGHLDATDIDVRVHDGEVTLLGFVDSRWAKRTAEDLASDVRGVRDVHNRLRIRAEGPTEQGEGYRDVYDLKADDDDTLLTTRVAERPAITEGMTVWDEDGQQVGTVKEVRANDFLLDRSGARDVYVPFSAVSTVADDGVRLHVDSDDLDRWEKPGLRGSDNDAETVTA